MFKGTTPEELRLDIVRSLSSMFALSDDSTNCDYASMVGNIDLEWRRAMDDLRRQEAEAMIKGTYSKMLSYYDVWACIKANAVSLTLHFKTMASSLLNKKRKRGSIHNLLVIFLTGNHV